MAWIETFEVGMEGSAIYDETQAAPLESFLATFKGIKFASYDPLVVEYYSDTWYMDAEQNAVPFRTAFWPEYGYGQAAWHMMAVSNLAEENQELAYTADKSTALEVEWMSFIGGPSLGVFTKYLDQSYNNAYIPFPAILGDYITAEEAQQRYFNLKTWFGDHGHYWVGTGPFYLDAVDLVAKTLTLKHNPYFPTDAGIWDIFAAPKIATAEVDGPGRVTIGTEATFDVYLNDPDGNAYPAAEVSEVKYILFDATGAIAAVAPAEFVSDGYYTITLSADVTGALAAGSNKLEIVAVVIPVSIPGSGTFEFVTE
jgi:peptide/nickel transport system substrate-binding protein